MRERLIELLREPIPVIKGYATVGETRMSIVDAEKIADHLLANGVIAPPCKVGDAVFQIEKTCLACPHFKDGGYSDWCECLLDDNKTMFEVDFDKDCIYEIIETKFIYSMIDQIGKTVFLTREEAEKALKEAEG